MEKWKAVLILGVLAGALALAAAPPVQAAGAELHGWMLNRFYGQPGTSHFQMERLSLSAAKDIDPDLKTYIEFYYHHWVNLNPAAGSPWMLDSAYVNFTDKCGNQLRVGKGRNYCFGIVPTYPNRKHSEYGLVSETMTQERIVGAQYFGSSSDKKLDFGIALHNSLPLGKRYSGTDQAVFRGEPYVPHVADKGEGGNLAVSGRVAYRVVEGGKLGLSYRTGKLRSGDISFLRDNSLVRPNATSTTNRRWGADFDYKSPQGVVAQAEYFGAKASALDFRAWDVLAGFEPADPMGVKYYARYGRLNLDPYAVTANQYTWDQKQLILSVVKPLRKGKPVWLQLEYISNGEEPPPGTSKVNDNVLFAELFTGF